MVPATELRKPLDTGNGFVAASFSGDGSWLSVGAPHAPHGFVELCGVPPFDEAGRGDPAAVRRYRGWLTEDRFAFLRLELPGEDVGQRSAGIDAEGRLVWRAAGGGWSWSAVGHGVPGLPAVVQRYRLHAAPGTVATVRFRGRLDRCALAEITEVNPPEPLPVRTVPSLREAVLSLRAPELGCSAEVVVGTRNARSTEWVRDPVEGIGLAIEAGADTSAPVEVVITVSLRGGESDSDLPATDQPRATPAGQADVLGRITQGALRYVLDCTAVHVGAGERALLTDHRLLPLSWTRDAYYQALLLLEALPENRDVTDVVAAHLHWLWGRGRAAGTPWMRSHLPDGRPKDLAVQADQQLYPILELADYRRVTGHWPPAPRGGGAGEWGNLVASVWRGLPREGADGLLAGAENPADDPAELPFPLSTQILYWHTANQLAPWSGELGLDVLRLPETADGLRAAVDRYFTCEGPFGAQWAYESDGLGQYRRYQDANDLPTAFAPWWGFCAPGDELWVATMRFAFSAHNPGYVAGPYGGLGSAHTPGTWTLGDAQELAVARACDDAEREASVLERLRQVAGVDGLLPETYAADTGAWLARHWFAWPAAVLGVLHLDRIK